MIQIEKTEVVGWEHAIPIPIGKYSSYRVDTEGNVYNKEGKLLKQYLSENGYKRVSLCYKQKHRKFSVHRLVALAFIPNPNQYTQVNHKDENKANNKVENLEWCSCLYNLKYSNVIEKGNKAKQRKIFCKTTNEIFNSVKDACEKYGLSHSNIIACCNGKRSKTGGLQWKYLT